MNYSAKKRARQNKKSRLHNASIKSRTRTLIRSFNEAVKQNDKEKALECLKVCQKALDSSVSKNVLHKKTASRKLSRLTLAYNKIA